MILISNDSFVCNTYTYWSHNIHQITYKAWLKIDYNAIWEWNCDTNEFGFKFENEEDAFIFTLAWS